MNKQGASVIVTPEIYELSELYLLQSDLDKIEQKKVFVPEGTHTPFPPNQSHPSVSEHTPLDVYVEQASQLYQSKTPSPPPPWCT
jgi:hypothetical protein